MHGKVTLFMGNGPWHLVSALATLGTRRVPFRLWVGNRKDLP